MKLMGKQNRFNIYQNWIIYSRYVIADSFAWMVCNGGKWRKKFVEHFVFIYKSSLFVFEMRFGACFEYSLDELIENGMEVEKLFF